MKITPTSLLSSTVSAVMTIALGWFMIISASFIIFCVLDGYKNYQKYKQIDVAYTGYYHSFHFLETESHPLGTTRWCVALTTDKYYVAREILKKTPGDFCERLMSRNNLGAWRAMVPANKSSTIELLFWSAVFFIVFMTSAYIWATIPSNLFAMLVPKYAPLVKLFAIILTLPVFVFWCVFVWEAWNPEPTHWVSPNGYSVKVTKVFVTKDNRMFIAPTSLYDWSSNDTMQEIDVGKVVETK